MPAALGTRHDLAPRGEINDLDLERGFLANLAMQGGVEGFAKFDPAARQRIKTPGRRSGAAHQQDFAIAENCRADGKLRVGGLKEGRQGMIPKSGN